MGKISPARLAAARTLLSVETEPGAQAADVLSRQVVENQIRPDDARLARAIVFGVLRHALTLDYYFAAHLKQPADKLDVKLRILLRMAAYQAYALSKVPDYAVVNESVELAKTTFRMRTAQAGFLNAILRKIVSAEIPRELPKGNRVSNLVVRYSFPDFLVRMLVDKYGTHKAVAIMEACNEEPTMTIRANLLQSDRERLATALADEGFVTQPATLAPEALIVNAHPDNKSLFESSAFRDGMFYAQDEGSQMIAHLVAAQAGEHILDMCSAPGGKATHMAELSGGGARITATDFSSVRLKLVAENIERLRTPQVEVKPLEEILAGAAQFDAVLVDAPCSGMGTIRRNPEIRYRVTQEELERQATRQIEVLRQAAPLVREGGRLVYSTCSMSDVENRNVIAKFLLEHPEFIVKGKPVEDEVADAPAVSGIDGLQRDDGFYATWPMHPHVDGFEAVVLLRRPLNGNGDAVI